MNKPDDFEQLWRTQPLETAVKGEEMREIILKKITSFDRTIRRRNTRETVAAVVVAICFGFVAWKQHNRIEQLGSATVVAGALWIIFYIRRHGVEPADPVPDQSVTAYRRALILKYEHQIRLLRNVKFWYLTPMYLGLLVSSAGMLTERAQTRPITWADAIPPLVYTLIFAGVWWLNEVYGVRKLQQMRFTLEQDVQH
jgi:hypothetical protein